MTFSPLILVFFILVILHYKKHRAICSHQEDTPAYQRPIQKDFWGAFTLRQLDLPTLLKYSLLDYGYISYYKKIDTNRKVFMQSWTLLILKLNNALKILNLKLRDFLIWGNINIMDSTLPKKSDFILYIWWLIKWNRISVNKSHNTARIKDMIKLKIY